MSQLSIQNSSTLHPTGYAKGPTPFTEQDRANMPPPGHFSTRPYTAVKTKSAAIEIQTAQGDKVTLTYSSETAKTSYIRPAGTYLPGAPDAETSSNSLMIEIRGDLNEQEKADIAAFQEEVSAVIENFLSRDAIDGDLSGLDLSRYESLTQYAASIDTATATVFASEMITAPETALRPLPDFPAFHTDSPGVHTDSPGARLVYNNKAESVPLHIQNQPSPVPAPTAGATSGFGFTTLKAATQELFSDHSKLAEEDTGDNTRSERLNLLESDFLELIDQLISLLENQR